MDWYRSVLEVHKFLPAKDVLISASVVHTTWARASDSEELWTLLCEHLESISPSLPPKSAYRMFAFSKVRLVLIHTASMRFFNCIAKRWESAIPLSQSLIVDYCSSAAIMSDGSVFLSGGAESVIPGSISSLRYMKDAFHIERDGNVVSLQPMNGSRIHHALIEVRGAIYVFGGKFRFEGKPMMTLRSCEKWRIPPDQMFPAVSWEALPDAPDPIWGCNPCAHQLLVYINGNKEMINVFNTETKTFTSWLSSSGNGIAQQVSLFIYEGDLLILRHAFLDRYQMTEPACVFKSTRHLSGVFANSSINPVLRGSELFHVDYVTGITFCFDIAQERTTKTYRS